MLVRDLILLLTNSAFVSAEYMFHWHVQGKTPEGVECVYNWDVIDFISKEDPSYFDSKDNKYQKM